MLLKNISVIVLGFLLVIYFYSKYFMLKDSKLSTSKNPLSTISLQVKGLLGRATQLL